MSIFRTLAIPLAILLLARAGPAAAHPYDASPDGATRGPSAGTIQHIRLPVELPERFRVAVRLDGQLRILHLERHSVRAAGFRVRAWLANGRMVEIPPPEPATYRGWVEEVPRAAVVASLTPEGMNARVFLRGTAAWTIRGLPGEDRASGEAAHSVRSAAHPPAGGSAAGPPDEISRPGGETSAPGRSSTASHTGQHLTEIAFDAANPFYVVNGSSVPATVAAVEALLDQVDFFFARDVLISYTITEIIVRTSPFYDHSDPNVLLQQFIDEWNTNQAEIPRDVAHLVTDGVTESNIWGYAATHVICNLTEAYSSSSGGDWVMGHELAHNWGGSHCHDYVPCNTLCGNCLASAPKLNDVIEAYRDSVSCLDETGGHPDPLPPYAELDFTEITRDEVAAGGASRTFAVLANDRDGNLDALSIDGFDATSQRGGSISLSPPDELIYTPPATVFPGDDHFTYTVSDGTALETTEADVEVRVAAPNLVGYWKLDEGSGLEAFDSSGGDRTGSFPTGAATWTAGVYGSALQFSAFFPGGVTIPGIKRDMPSATITAWVKRSGSQNPFAGIFVENGPNGLAGLNFGVANELRYQWDDDPAASGWDSGLVVPNNQWVLAAVAVEPDRATIYLHDGTTLQSAVNSISHAPQDFGGDMWIGVDPLELAARGFAGVIDDVRVYDYALTSADITALHDNGGKAFAPEPPDGGGILPGTRELTWAPGLEAASHDVYFGTDYEAVRDATTASPEFRGNQASTTFLAPPPLTRDTTFSWRVDEVTAGGTVRGDVWVFAVGPPVARWKLDETSGTTAVDSVGGLDGTYLGGPLLDQAPAQPELGRSAFFDGTDDSVELPALNLGRNEATFTVRLRRDGAQAEGDGIFVTRSGSTVAGLVFGAAQDLRYKWNDFFWSFEFSDTGLVVPNGRWVLLALVIHQDRVEVYLGDSGGLSKTVGHIPNDREEFDGPLYLAQDPLGGRFFRGWLDDMRVYDHALSPAEVGALFAAGTGAGRVPDGEGVPGEPLRVEDLPGGDVSLTWSGSCVGADTDYAVYEGQIGDFTSHLPVRCSTGGATSFTVTPRPGDRYFLVAPTSADREGGYGTDGAGQPRPASTAACLVQFVVACD